MFYFKKITFKESKVQFMATVLLNVSQVSIQTQYWTYQSYPPN